jgi:hypothetical protein
MKYDITQPLVLFNGVSPTVGTSEAARPMTLRDALEFACVNASAELAKTGEQKLKFFTILERVHDAALDVELSAEDVALIKKSAGELYTIPMVGALYKALEGAQG